MKTIKVSPIKLGKYDLRSTNKYMLNKIVHQKSKIVNIKNYYLYESNLVLACVCCQNLLHTQS